VTGERFALGASRSIGHDFWFELPVVTIRNEYAVERKAVTARLGKSTSATLAGTQASR
jgi:hypothetical protein